jgi:hypothetical protein
MVVRRRRPTGAVYLRFVACPAGPTCTFGSSRGRGGIGRRARFRSWYRRRCGGSSPPARTRNALVGALADRVRFLSPAGRQTLRESESSREWAPRRKVRPREEAGAPPPIDDLERGMGARTVGRPRAGCPRSTSVPSTCRSETSSPTLIDSADDRGALRFWSGDRGGSCDERPTQPPQPAARDLHQGVRGRAGGVHRRRGNRGGSRATVVQGIRCSMRRRDRVLRNDGRGTAVDEQSSREFDGSKTDLALAHSESHG